MSELLSAKKLSKTYTDGSRSLDVLTELDLLIERGETVAITGPSGSGKSTLLHLLGGLDKPTGGSVYLDGTDIYETSEKQLSRIRNRKLGFVFQFYHLLAEFSVKENVMIPALLGIRRPGAEKKALELIERVGLIERLEYPPSRLSGGERQRVAIARALVNDPEIVMADEPTGNLDELNSKSILRMMFELNEERGITLVIATHEEKLAREAGRVFRLVGGKLREDKSGTKNIC